MRIFRNKANRKTLAFFRINYKLHPPYRVLVDGNFIAQAERLKMEWQRLVPKLLQVEADQCFLHVTDCVMAELGALGEGFVGVVEVAKNLPLLKCRKKHGHGEGTDASDCIHQLVGSDNTGKWIVVTQDANLRTALRGVAGTPLALISNNVLVLEPPSNDSRQASSEAEVSKIVLSKAESRAVRTASAQLSAAGVASSSTSAPKSDVVGSLAPKYKHYAAGPNPLSMQRKKKRGEEEEQGGNAADDTDASTVGRKRRRKTLHRCQTE